MILQCCVELVKGHQFTWGVDTVDSCGVGVVGGLSLCEGVRGGVPTSSASSQVRV